MDVRVNESGNNEFPVDIHQLLAVSRDYFLARANFDDTIISSKYRDIGPGGTSAGINQGRTQIDHGCRRLFGSSQGQTQKEDRYQRCPREMEHRFPLLAPTPP